MKRIFVAAVTIFLIIAGIGIFYGFWSTRKSNNWFGATTILKCSLNQQSIYRQQFFEANNSNELIMIGDEVVSCGGDSIDNRCQSVNAANDCTTIYQTQRNNNGLLYTTVKTTEGMRVLLEFGKE